MRRIVTRVGLIGSVVSLLLVGFVFRGPQLRVVPKAHAEEKENGSCSIATLNGAYAFYRTGPTSGGPLAAVGIATYDGNGTTTVRQTIRKNGVTTSDNLFTGPAGVASYEIDPDCAGRLVNPDGTDAAHFVVVDGKEFFGLSLSPGNSVNVVWKKITRDKD